MTGAPEARPARLVRSRSDRIISGVSGGLGAYMNVDPTLIRIGWVVLAVVTGGTAVIGYVAMWLIVPEGGDGERETLVDGSETGRWVLGGILIVAGAAWLLASLLPHWLRFSGFAALALMAVGVVLLVQGTRR